MTWEQTQPMAAGMSRIQHEQLPQPVNIDVTRTLVTVIPNRDSLVIGLDGAQKLDWLDTALDRLEMLLARQESLESDPRAAGVNHQLIFELQSQITARLPRGFASPSPKMPIHLERWNRIVSTLNQLESHSAPRTTAVPESRPLQIEEPFLDLPNALRVAPVGADHSVNFWLLDRRWLDVVGALLLCLIAIPLFRRLIRLEWGEWLNSRTTIAWLLLGIVWWLWLTPGPVGSLIVTITILRAGLHRRQSRNSVMVVEE